ncbi:MAG: hypothetical protein R2800_14970 [Flavipsychrobacter sp.]
MRRTVVATMMVVVALAAGCKKKDIDNSEVTFINRLDKPITLDIYSSFDAYSKGGTPLLRKSMLGKETTYLPGNTFPAGSTYYMDWYSDDFYNNNWYNDKFETNKVTELKPEPGNNTYYMDPRLYGDARKAFLNNTDAATRWIAIGAYLYASGAYTDQWSSLTPNERTKEITITRGFKANYKYRNANGQEQTAIYDFMVHQTATPYIEFKDGSGNSAGNMTGGKLPTATPPDYVSNNTDTLMALLPGNDYLFMMVKQK